MHIRGPVSTVCRQLLSDNAIYAANNELVGESGGDPSPPGSVRGSRMRHGTGTVNDRRASCASVMWDTSPLATFAADTPPRERQDFLRRRHLPDRVEAAPTSPPSLPLHTFEQTIGKRRERRRFTQVMVDVSPQRSSPAEQPYDAALFERRRHASLAAISTREATLTEVCTTLHALHSCLRTAHEGSITLYAHAHACTCTSTCTYIHMPMACVSVYSVYSRTAGARARRQGRTALQAANAQSSAWRQLLHSQPVFTAAWLLRTHTAAAINMAQLWKQRSRRHARQSALACCHA